MSPDFEIGEWVRVRPAATSHVGGVGRVAAVNEFVWVTFTDTVLPFAASDLESVQHLRDALGMADR